MSVEASKWAWEQDGVSTTEKIVLLCLADHADDEGENCYPSQNRIAKKTKLARPTVNKAVKSLIEKGLIVTLDLLIYGKTLMRYKLNLNRGVTEDYRGCNRGLQGVSATITGGVTEDYTNHHRTIIEPSKEEDNASPPNGGAAEWPSVDNLVALYNDQTPSDCPMVKEISPARRDKAKKYLTMFPKREFWERVFQRIHESRFLKGVANGPGHENFIADFDWLLTKGKDGTENVVKVYEGKYQDRHGD